MARIFLALVGAIYIALGLWCIVQPARTAESIGYSFSSGSGQSEYLTVYGGLQAGLGFAFLAALWRPQDANALLLACLAAHAGIVLLRSAGFFLYGNIQPTTYVLAAIEWIVLLGSAILFAREEIAP